MPAGKVDLPADFTTREIRSVKVYIGRALAHQPQGSNEITDCNVLFRRANNIRCSDGTCYRP